MTNLFVHFAKDQSGATLVEYGLIAAALAVAVVAMMSTIGDGLSTVATDIKNRLTGGGSTQ